VRRAIARARAYWIAACGVAAASLLACRGGAGGDDDAEVFLDATTDGAAGDGGSDGGDAAASGQVDRAGRPLVALMLVPGAQQDPYNAVGSFVTPLPVALQNALQARLVELDTLALGDGGPDPVDWPVPDAGQHPLLGMFAADVLLVDTARSCVADGGFVASYLDLERELYLSGPPHATCGGRSPGENVVDETLQLVVTGDRDGGPVVTQGVAGPSRPASTTFPYLAPPN